MACVAVNSLMRTIELEFLQPQPRPILQEKELISSNKELIQSLHEKLGFLIELFDENRMDGVEAIKDLETKLRDVAFGVEDEIELHVVDLCEEAEEFGIANLFLEEPQGDTEAKKTRHSHRISRILQQAIEDIDAIKEELVKVTMEYKHVKMDSSSEHASHSDQDIMVGKNKEFETIREMLIEHPSKQPEVVSVQGMGGIGKTTLARRVYEDPSIASHFDKRAWVVASQHHNKREMLIGLLKSMGKEETSSDEELALQLYQGLNGQRDMAVMDDLQSKEDDLRRKEARDAVKRLKTRFLDRNVRRVYEDPSITSHFDKRVASQHHNKRQMFLDLLNYLKDNAKAFTDEKLAEILYQSLKCQRYLVVMDDVWSREAWNDVKSCFPNDRNGSRVLLTTRVAEVANYTCSNNDFSHQMHLLDQSESWNLFCEKACISHSAEFEMIVRPIVEKCKGLPLAIVVVAGLFSKLNTPHEWKNIAKALNSSASTTVAEACSRLLSLSYNHLPHNLKACFLYLGVFPKGIEIYAKNLARLWVAEGLVKVMENKSFDVVAKRYIKELMDRNIIHVVQRSCCGRKIKTFKIHDLLHAFCEREAQKENLLHVVYEKFSNLPQRSFRWVRIESVDFDIPTLYSSSKSCRSVFYFSKVKCLNLKIFNLLRVLRFPEPCLDWKIDGLIHLRFLSPLCDTSDILKQFHAWNLQSLSICDEDDKTIYLEFPQLQHFDCYFIYGHPPKFVHENLQSISWLKPYHCTKEFFANVPYLKKLKISGKRRDCNDCIENLVYLQQLERLYIYADEWHHTIPHVTPINNSIVLLENLKKLSFHSMSFEWKGINVLSKLPRLEVLKLINFACVGKEWELPEKEKFCQLIVLRIGSTNLKHWKANRDHFPKLEHLFLHSCKKLEEIPADFAEILTLKSIKLKGCLPSAVISAKEIEEEQRCCGNNDMVVIEENTIQVSLSLSLCDEDEFDEPKLEQRRP